MNHLPHISISREEGVKIRTIDDNELPSNIIWISAILDVHDNIYMGPTRSVLIEYCQDSEYTFLKTINPLHKSEFEFIFGFEQGEFIKGRVIRVLLEKMNITS